MTSIYQLKPRFQQLLRPLSNSMAALGVSANQVTLLAMTLSIATGISLVLFSENPHIYLLLPLMLFIRMALNAIDGMLAREHHMQSPLGAMLNELGDVVSDAALYLPFALLSTLNPVWPLLAVVLAIISEMTGVIAIQIGASRRYDGPMGKSDRAFVYGLLALLLGLEISLTPWLDLIFIVMNLLLLITIVNRARQALKELQHVQ